MLKSLKSQGASVPRSLKFQAESKEARRTLKQGAVRAHSGLNVSLCTHSPVRMLAERVHDRPAPLQPLECVILAPQHGLHRPRHHVLGFGRLGADGLVCLGPSGLAQGLRVLRDGDGRERRLPPEPEWVGATAHWLRRKGVSAPLTLTSCGCRHGCRLRRHQLCCCALRSLGFAYRVPDPNRLGRFLERDATL